MQTCDKYLNTFLLITLGNFRNPRISLSATSGLTVRSAALHMFICIITSIFYNSTINSVEPNTIQIGVQKDMF